MSGVFLSTRDYDYIYNFIVRSSKKNCENILKKKLDLFVFKKKKLPSFKYFCFLLFIIFSGKIFNTIILKLVDLYWHKLFVIMSAI